MTDAHLSRSFCITARAPAALGAKQTLTCVWSQLSNVRICLQQLISIPGSMLVTRGLLCVSRLPLNCISIIHAALVERAWQEIWACSDKQNVVYKWSHQEGAFLLSSIKEINYKEM